MVMPNSKKRHSTLMNVVVLIFFARVALKILISRITTFELAGWQDVITNRYPGH